MPASRNILAAVLLTCLGVLPIFLVGALSPFLARELGLDGVALGTVVAAYFLVSSIVSVPAGRLVERIGGRRGGDVSSLISVISLLGVATLAHDRLALTAFVALGGAGNAIGQLASNVVVARGVPTDRLGVAYGIKQSAIPIATLLGGISVPLLGLTIGWRWAFGLAGLLAVSWLVLLPADGETRPVPTRTHGVAVSPSITRQLLPLAFAAALGAGSANAMGTFFVASAISAGVPVALAGVLLAIGGALSIIARIAFGARADRGARNELGTIGAMLLAGSLAGLMFTTMEPLLIVFAMPIGFALGWGWNGLLNLAVVRMHAETPAAATSVTQAGLFAGGVLGPLSFGLVVEALSYGVAWLVAAAAMAIAGLTVLGRAMIERREDDGRASLAGNPRASVRVRGE